MKTIAIMQPTYLPWLGYFDLINSSDAFVFYDDVQFEKQSWQSRNRVKTTNGELLLSIPIKNHPLNFIINQIEIDLKNPWKKKHLKAIYYNYIKSNNFKEVYPFVEELINKEILNLSNFNANIIIEICKKIGIKTELLFSSNLISREGQKDKRLITICNELGATSYLSPIGSSKYIEETNPEGAFANTNVQLFYQNYKHPVYKQINGEFRPYMCIFDLLFNEGFENALSVIKSGRQEFLTSKELKYNEK